MAHETRMGDPAYPHATCVDCGHAIPPFEERCSPCEAGLPVRGRCACGDRETCRHAVGPYFAARYAVGRGEG